MVNETGGVVQPGEDEELLGQRRKSTEMARLKSGWTLLMTNLILEIAYAVFDQLGYALVGMVLAFVALLLATADLIHMARKERMSLLPIFHRPSTATFVPGKPAGTIVEYFGLVVLSGNVFIRQWRMHLDMGYDLVFLLFYSKIVHMAFFHSPVNGRVPASREPMTIYL
ncbi:hypothetical protein DKX38_028786 [Salix brachista]|uniref:Uncharacterized protein n=1 Tax=Salix brachista TaxID=2182728 RepID=A0A5N5IXG3_9ROSI|nr:hypothetical protein DKX38_028786 [Salix brachista]